MSKETEFRVGEEVLLTGKIVRVHRRKKKPSNYLSIEIHDGVCGMNIVTIVCHQNAVLSVREDK